MTTIFYTFGHRPRTGGDYVNLEHIHSLRKWGIDARIAFIGNAEDEPKDDVFGDIPVLFSSRGAIYVNDGDIFVVPEGFSGIIPQFANKDDALSQTRLVIHNQNPFYTHLSFEQAEALNAHPIEMLIVPSEYAARRLREMRIEKPIEVVRPYIPDYFKPRLKSRDPIKIVYSSRKREQETHIMQFYLKSYYPDDLPLQIVDIKGISRERVAEEMADAAIFLSFAEREAMGLMALEAMASGCHIVGFSGYSGGYSEFMNDENGDWIEEGDYLRFTQKVFEAARAFYAGEVSQKALAGLKTVDQFFRQPHFEDQLKATFEKLLGQRL